MPRITRFALCNPLQFTLQNKGRSDVYNIQYPNDGWSFSETNRLSGVGTYQATYWQKILLSDLICVQVDSNCNYEPVLTIYDVNMLVVDTITTPHTSLSVAGNNDRNSGEGLTTYQWIFRLTDYSATDAGYYRIGVETEFDISGGTATDTHLSEWLDARSSHDNTVLIKYHNARNDYDTMFSSVVPDFRIRIEGHVHDWDTGFVSTSYTNQREEVIDLYNAPYDVCKASFVGIPDYMLMKLARIFALSHVAIDGKRLQKDEGAKLEKQKIDNTFPLYSASIKLRPYQNNHSLLTSRSQFPLWEEGLTPPFAVEYPSIKDDINIVWLESYPATEGLIIEDNTAGTAKAAEWNSEAASRGLDGTFVYDSGCIYYTNGDGENYEANTAYCAAQPSLLNAEVETLGVTKTATIAHVGSSYTVDWGDGSDAEYVTQTVSGTATTHVYAVADTYTVRIFSKTDNGPYALSFSSNYSGTQFTWRDFTGVAPTNLQEITVFDASLSGSFTMNFLNGARANLTKIKFRLCGIVHPFLGTFLDGSNLLFNMTEFDLRNNAISTAGVNNIIDKFHDNVAWPPVGSRQIFHLRLELGTNGAPSGGAIPDKAEINNAWSGLVPIVGGNGVISTT